MEKKKEVIKDPNVEKHPANQSHEEIHPHVNPHVDAKEVPEGTYHHDKKVETEPPMKSRLRLDWIWTKVRIGKFYPIPIVTILLIGLPMIPMLLAALGFPIINMGYLVACFYFSNFNFQKNMVWRVLSVWFDD